MELSDDKEQGPASDLAEYYEEIERYCLKCSAPIVDVDLCPMCAEGTMGVEI